MCASFGLVIYSQFVLLFFLFRTEGRFKTIDSVLGANSNEDSYQQVQVIQDAI